MIVRCSTDVVSETLAHLQIEGRRERECVVLWLARRSANSIDVEAAFRPIQFARSDIFRIPPKGMDALRDELRRTRLMVAAQVHSQPREAFHSQADDDWAIVRHEGALSLVVPNFASDISTDNFLDNAKVYRFSVDAEWQQVPPYRVPV